MSAPLWCSVADVTVQIKASEAKAAGLSDSCWYGGAWFGINGAMYFRVVGDGASRGLYYWDPAHAEFFWNNYTVTTSGAGTLSKAFSGGELDCELRFVTTMDPLGAHEAKVYLDGVLLDTRVATGSPTAEELVSWLWVSCGGKPGGVGSETFRVGAPEATVWQTSQIAPYQVIVEDDAPVVVDTASHLWAPWVAWLQAGEDAEDYRAGDDLFAAGYWDETQLEVDGDGLIYGASQTGDTFLEVLQVVFQQYALAGVPNLSLSHHPVSNALLVTDAGLANDGSVGYWTVMNR